MKLLKLQYGDGTFRYVLTRKSVLETLKEIPILREEIFHPIKLMDMGGRVVETGYVNFDYNGLDIPKRGILVQEVPYLLIE